VGFFWPIKFSPTHIYYTNTSPYITITSPTHNIHHKIHIHNPYTPTLDTITHTKSTTPIHHKTLTQQPQHSSLVLSPPIKCTTATSFSSAHFTGFLICSQFKRFLMFNSLPYGCLLEGPLKRLMLSMDHIDKVWLWFQVNQNLLNIFTFPINTNNNTTNCTPTQPHKCYIQLQKFSRNTSYKLPTRHI